MSLQFFDDLDGALHDLDLTGGRTGTAVRQQKTQFVHGRVEAIAALLLPFAVFAVRTLDPNSTSKKRIPEEWEDAAMTYTDGFFVISEHLNYVNYICEAQSIPTKQTASSLDGL